ncbi:extracellular solute-binding protein [Arthrobacter sp. NtRootA1]|uniref:ABC transporter substrate-binding protein n=1 Tax=Micrococcaceae TaxID=1268 RepID=UPI001CC4C211|nr:extracellular solute-binding protein [Arthrobacter sp. NtRootA1]BCW05841.1 sugar ABC transporter substrate-binding protein [Arthrobacter sp. NtRootA1]
MKKASKTAAAMAVLAGITGFMITGCSPAGTSPAQSATAMSQEDFDKAMSTPTKLTFWTWLPDVQNEVALFEKKYPQIDVTVENVGQGGEHYQKVRTALQSGDGAPDVIQLEYQYIPSFNLTNSLLNLRPYGADDISGDYVDWAWKQVSNDKGVWAVPQDVGPMGNLYRTDILEKAGITKAPATYEEYAADAKAVKEKTGSYISNLPTNDPAQVIGLLWQAGVKPFSYDGDKTVGINVNSAEAKKVLAYWQDLIQKDLISVDADFNDQYYQGLASDKYAGWLTAAWAPIFLQGTVENTAGKWAAAPLPQWSAGEQVSGNWGGSSDAVLKTTKNPIAAAELAKFINHDEESTKMFATKQFLFPAAKSVLEDSSYTDQKVAFFGGQQVNKLFGQISNTVDTDFQWLPFTEYAYSQFNEIVGTAIGAKGDLNTALDKWQETLVSYAKDQGFTVK